MAQKTSRQLQAEETKRSIFLIVADIMKAKNIEDIKIRDICERAGISVGTFYHYFPSKEAAILYSAREMDDMLSQIKMDGTPWENVGKFIKGYYNIAGEGNEVMKQMMACRLKYYDEYYFNETRPMFHMLHDQIASLTGAGQDSQKLTWRILFFCQGRQYNLFAGPPDIDISTWRSEQIEHTMGYIDYLLNYEKTIPRIY